MQISDILNNALPIITAFGVLFGGLATYFLVRLQLAERKQKRLIERAKFTRDRLLNWSGSLSYVTFSDGKISSREATDPDYFRDSPGRERLEEFAPGLWEKWENLKVKRIEEDGKLRKLYEGVLNLARDLLTEDVEMKLTMIQSSSIAHHLYESGIAHAKNTKREFLVESSEGGMFRLHRSGIILTTGTREELEKIKANIDRLLNRSHEIGLFVKIHELEESRHSEQNEFRGELSQARVNIESRFLLEPREPSLVTM